MAISVKDHSVSREVFSLSDCTECGFRFTNPRPDPSHIGSYYLSPTYISHTNASSSLQDRLYQQARRWALSRKYKLIRRHQPHGSVLDIGCGTGEFLAYLKSRGYWVRGVEPSTQAREQAIANHSLEVVPSLASVASQEQFQVVTLWHVLEHLPSPHETLKQVFASLADRGLLIIAVPNRGSWDASHYGTAWAAWDVPRHLSHFRQQDVHKLLHDHGFQLMATKRMWLDAFYVALLSEQYRGSSKLLSLLKGGLIGGWSNLVSLISGRPASSSLFIARKVAS